MANEQLVAHIKSEFARGIDRANIRQALLDGGWKDEDITAAFVAIDSAAPPKAAIPAPAKESSDTDAPKPPPTAAAMASAASKAHIQNIAAGLFIFCVVVLTGISVLGVWNYFSSDVILKSFETLGLLALVSIIVIIASKFIGDPVDKDIKVPASPGFVAIRNLTLVVLIASAVLLTFIGVLAIWNVIQSSTAVHRALSSLGILIFSSLIIVLICLEREQNELWEKRGGQLSGGTVFAGIVLIWFLLSFGNW